MDNQPPEFDPIRTRASLLDAILDPRNEHAWSRFIDKYTPLIFRWCNQKGLRRDEKEDIKGTVLRQVVRAMKDGFRYDPSKRFRDWLRTVVENKIRDLRRQQGRKPFNWATGDSQVQEFLETRPAEMDIDFDDLVDRLDDTISRDLAVVTAKVRARVSETTWKSFYQTAIEDHSPREVASQLGITVSAVYVNKSRVIVKFREEFALLNKVEGS